MNRPSRAENVAANLDLPEAGHSILGRTAEVTEMPGSENPEVRWVEIGRGGEGTIEIDRRSGIVRKRFTGRSPEVISHLARNEFEYLRRYQDELADEPFLRCPEALSVRPELGQIQMSFCPGERLDMALQSQADAVQRDIDHIAEQILRAVDAYLYAFEEPFHTIRTHNMLYDEKSGVLSIVDLYGINRFDDSGFERAVEEISLGRLIGGAIFRSVRPKTTVRRSYWAGHLQLLNALMEKVRGRNRLSLNLIRRASDDLYAYSAKHWQPKSYVTLRRFWYQSVGKSLYQKRANAVFEFEY